MSSEHSTHEEGKFSSGMVFFEEEGMDSQDGMSGYGRLLEEKEERVEGDLLWPHMGSGYFLDHHRYIIFHHREFGQSQTDMILVMSLASSVN